MKSELSFIFHPVNIFQCKISRARDFGALSIMGVRENIIKECASHVTLFIQALSLEFAGERRFTTLAALANKTLRMIKSYKIPCSVR